MKVSLICIGTKMPDWIEAGVDEYRKRLLHAFELSIVEIPLPKRHKSSVATELKVKEGEAMLAKIKASDQVVACDIRGKPLSTESLATHLEQWQHDNLSVCLLIGGPDGLSEACLARANQTVSLSELTLPHPLVRVLLCEQLYRAHSLLNNHPYHRV